MTIAITAIFPSLAAAQAAADCLAVCPDRSSSLQVSLEHCDHGAVTAASRMFCGGHTSPLLDITPTAAVSLGREQSALVRVRCGEQLSSFVARELAALGAEKITITPLS